VHGESWTLVLVATAARAGQWLGSGQAMRLPLPESIVAGWLRRYDLIPPRGCPDSAGGAENFVGRPTKLTAEPDTDG
jgi:hypothetical protein